VSCGKFPTSIRGGYSAVECEDAVGDTIKISSTAFFGTVEVFFEGEATSQPTKVLTRVGDITESYHVSKQYQDEATYGAPKMLDGHEGMTNKDFFYGQPNSYVSVTLDGVYDIKTVYVVNRGDSNEARLLNMQVEICEEFTALTCTSCGKFPTAPKGGYSKVECPENTFGDTIKISSTSWIQIVEVYIEADKTEKDTKEILAASDHYEAVWASYQFGSETTYGPQKMVDGLSGPLVSDSFISYANGFASVTLDATYDITKVYALNRGDYDEARLAKTEVEICTDFTVQSCVSCGKFPETIRLGYGSVDCPQDATGDTIKFSSVDWLGIVEVYFEGSEAESLPTDLVWASDVYSSSFLNRQFGSASDWGPQIMVDGILSYSRTMGVQGSYASVSLESVYEIDSVLILSSTRSPKTTLVEVCSDFTATSCKSCGLMPDVLRGQYASVKCPNGTSGDTIKFSNTDYLEIAEVFFHGRNTSEEPKNILAAHDHYTNTFASLASSTTLYPKERMVDGAIGTLIGDMFHGKPNGYATITLDESYDIKSVFVVSRGDGQANLLSYVAAEICEGYKCISCGKFPDTAVAAYGKVSCPSEASGDIIKFTSTSWLQIVEVFFEI
jgi:hypothetical protein